MPGSRRSRENDEPETTDTTRGPRTERKPDDAPTQHAFDVFAVGTYPPHTSEAEAHVSSELMQHGEMDLTFLFEVQVAHQAT